MKSEKSRRSFLRNTLSGSILLSPMWYAPPRQTEILKPYTGSRDDRLPCTILSAYEMDEAFLSAVKALSPDIQLMHRKPGESATELLPKADVYVGRLSEEDFALAKNLKWIHSTSAGVEKQLFPEVVESQVMVTNAKGCYAPAIADHTIGMLLALTRQISSQIKKMPTQTWGSSAVQVEMKEMTMGIVGFGGIGRQIARRAKGLDMNILAVDIQAYYPEQIGDLCDELYHVDGGGLETLLSQSDVVVCAAPHTAKSEGMFGEAQFAQMKPGSYFINVSRGKLVQTPALLAAIQSGHLQGVALDVTDPEPLPSGHPLWAEEQVIITSHMSGRSQFSRKRVQSVLVDNINRYIHGYPLLNWVDKEAGF
ncbi:MAG: D-2-hydroxyacid dehydrogenase [Saprospiraceae bacterium]|nr:D-2-hydroxyacid dehydrogenase [Saprospiraceae bacterium]